MWGQKWAPEEEKWLVGKPRVRATRIKQPQSWGVRETHRAYDDIRALKESLKKLEKQGPEKPSRKTEQQFRPTMWYYVTKRALTERCELHEGIKALRAQWTEEGFEGIYNLPAQPAAFTY